MKAGLRSSIIIWDSDAYCSKNHRPSHNTFLKVQIQGSNNKDSFHSKKSKSKDPKPAPLRDNAVAEPTKKKDKKNKKKVLGIKAKIY